MPGLRGLFRCSTGPTRSLMTTPGSRKPQHARSRSEEAVYSCVDSGTTKKLIGRVLKKTGPCENDDSLGEEEKKLSNSNCVFVALQVRELPAYSSRRLGSSEHRIIVRKTEEVHMSVISTYVFQVLTLPMQSDRGTIHSFCKIKRRRCDATKIDHGHDPPFCRLESSEGLSVNVCTVPIADTTYTSRSELLLPPRD